MNPFAFIWLAMIFGIPLALMILGAKRMLAP